MDFKGLLGITPDKLILSIQQSIYMVLIALFIGTIIGIPLGILLVLTREDGLLKNRFVFNILNNVINIIRSIPFVILLISIIPVTRALIGTTIGSNAAIVPLVFYISPYLARLIESSLLEVDKGIIEAAEAMGANTFQVIWYFLIPEALGSLVLALTTGTIGLIGASAMAGYIGGGGVGDLALTYGYQRMNTPLMVVTVIILVVFVQLIQTLGNYFSRKIRNHI
ncbi:methionine ABC transporter permease [Tissierella sp. Yu-01]|uniref:methionine ABC transporter permease n=1 Tax=Tissierella sp. Yu-01 TaxID=3035694 RepID=UPI00240DC915|nr:methionine ABC transporter permease [Tissierella sp. Yu-01]WFA08839.1 ABC transporter permease [Tissierella sp. Yu-01]